MPLLVKACSEKSQEFKYELDSNKSASMPKLVTDKKNESRPDLVSSCSMKSLEATPDHTSYRLLKVYHMNKGSKQMDANIQKEDDNDRLQFTKSEMLISDRFYILSIKRRGLLGLKLNKNLNE